MSESGRDQGGHLRVERGTHPGHLAPAEPLDAQGPDEVVEATGADPGDVRLLDDREQRALGPPPRVEQAGQVRPVTHPGDRQVDRANPRVPAPVAVPVAVRQTTPVRPHLVGRTGHAMSAATRAER